MRSGKPAIEMREVDVWRWVPERRERAHLLRGVDWTVAPGEHWVMLGANGAGKTTLLNMAGAVTHPSSGEVRVLGRRLGRTDMRALRERIGFVDARTAHVMHGRMPAEQIVLTGTFGSIAAQPDRLKPAHRERAAELIASVGATEVAERRFEDCSQGERQRVLLARALMAEPDLLLLDEPTSGLDLPSRERLIRALDRMAVERPELPTVIVTHHLEEIPSTSDRAVLLKNGRVLAAGPIEEALTDELVSECFEVEVSVANRGGRWSAATAGSAP